MAIRTIEGVRLTHTAGGWAAPNARFVFRKWSTGWVVADLGRDGIAHHPLVGMGGEGQHPTLCAAVREAKKLLVLQ